ncbi:hypothetical protein ACFVWY_09290 [Streptomyces sp. NPDC058195]|uniref:hypothetical protein n=1 Tax=Streptomyces sp. NPDC058195 TaxID=3346375 RepID=UPI0036E5A9E4
MPYPSPDQQPEVTGRLVNVGTALRTADDVLAIRLGAVTRREIDARNAELHVLVGLFADAVLDHARDAATRSVRWEVDRLLASAPGEGALVFSAYQHMHDLARMLRRLASSAPAQGGVTV